MHKYIDGVKVSITQEDIDKAQAESLAQEKMWKESNPGLPDAERIAALEEELRAAKILLGMEE